MNKRIVPQEYVDFQMSVKGYATVKVGDVLVLKGINAKCTAVFCYSEFFTPESHTMMMDIEKWLSLPETNDSTPITREWVELQHAEMKAEGPYFEGQVIEYIIPEWIFGAQEESAVVESAPVVDEVSAKSDTAIALEILRTPTEKQARWYVMGQGQEDRPLTNRAEAIALAQAMGKEWDYAASVKGVPCDIFMDNEVFHHHHFGGDQYIAEWIAQAVSGEVAAISYDGEFMGAWRDGKPLMEDEGHKVARRFLRLPN